MHSSIATGMAILTSLLAVAATSAAQELETTLDEATQFSLIYGYPLIAYAKFALNSLSMGSGFNNLEHERQLVSPKMTAVVRPNVDTLYSAGILDLSHKDLVFIVPEITDRFWVYPFYDVYGNNYANLGNINKTPPGKYHVRYSHAVGEEPGITLCEKPEQPGCDEYRGFINAPTPYGAFCGRVLVKNNGTDLNNVHAIQNQTLLYTVPRKPHGQPYAKRLTTGVLNNSLSSDLPTRIMQMTARIAPDNPPRNISDLPRVNNMLLKSGIRDGQFTPLGANLTLLAHQADEAVETYASRPKRNIDLKNGWQTLTPSIRGDYDLDYKIRYYVASTGYLALKATEAIYPKYYDPTTRSTSLMLRPKEAYTITFSGKPPLVQYGFWSITLYNKELFLVPNAIHHYALGDRSNLTDTNGNLVYGNNVKNSTFQVLIQPADSRPPRNWTSNWLPAPPGGGEILISLRFYGPKKTLLDGVWPYPVVKKHDVLNC